MHAHATNLHIWGSHLPSQLQDPDRLALAFAGPMQACLSHATITCTSFLAFTSALFASNTWTRSICPYLLASARGVHSSCNRESFVKLVMTLRLVSQHCNHLRIWCVLLPKIEWLYFRTNQPHPCSPPLPQWSIVLVLCPGLHQYRL